MEHLLSVLLDMVAPIFAIVAVGYAAGRLLVIDVSSLTKLNIYVFVPAFMFWKLLQVDLERLQPGRVLFALFALMGCLYLVSTIAARFLRLPRGLSRAFSNSVMFYNSGNYGLTLIELVFRGNPVAVSVQVLVLLVQNVLMYTVGIFQAYAGDRGLKNAISGMRRIPSIYVIPLALLLNWRGVDVPPAIESSLTYISGGLIPVALITLGVHLSSVEWRWVPRRVLTSCAVRLIGGPVLALCLVKLFSLDGLLGQVIVVSASVPTAVNTSIIALEFGNEPDFAVQTVLYSMLFSLVTVTFIVHLTLSGGLV